MAFKFVCILFLKKKSMFAATKIYFYFTKKTIPLLKKSKIQVFLEQNIYCNNIQLVKAKVRIAIIDTKGKISRMPSNLFNIF